MAAWGRGGSITPTTSAHTTRAARAARRIASRGIRRVTCPESNGRCGALGLHQPAADGVPRELDPVVHPQLLQDVGAMPVDRLLADDQGVSDLPGAVALGDELD